MCSTTEPLSSWWLPVIPGNCAVIYGHWKPAGLDDNKGYVERLVMKNKATTGLQVAVTILEKWGATTEQGTAILNVSPDTYAHAKQRDPEWQISLDDDQLARISYVLNIHAALRVLFDNPDNLYGFMGMADYNKGFDGRSPLEVIACGDIGTLRETWLRVNMERHAPAC